MKTRVPTYSVSSQAVIVKCEYEPAWDASFILTEQTWKSEIFFVCLNRSLINVQAEK